jgi:hypothetical protein
MEFTEAQVAKLNLQPGEILVVTIKSHDVDTSVLESFKKTIQKFFDKNQVLIFACAPEEEINFSTIAESSVGCGTQSYCGDCSCGKKEQYEKLKPLPMDTSLRAELLEEDNE